MKAGKRYSRLGYTGEDIDWLGGGVITTNNNNGGVGTPYVNRGTNPYGTRGAGRHYDEIEGGKIKNPFKSVSKAFAPVKKTFDKAGVKLNTGAAKVATAINPMTYALGNKDTRNAMIQSGKITHDYLLPAVVSAGKPIFDATAMVGSTMLTGNPLLGKVAADTVWNEMVTKKGNDPRQNQKSKELGELSTVFGQALAKPYSAALGGNIVADEFRRRDRQRRVGGASYEQMGRAATMRPVADKKSVEYQVLSDIVHSAELPPEYPITEYTNVYPNNPNRDAEIALNAFEPTFVNQLYYKILNDSEIDRETKQLALSQLLSQYPEAKKGIPRDRRWGANNPKVRELMASSSSRAGEQLAIREAKRARREKAREGAMASVIEEGWTTARRI
jgi:hypothetical protein